MWKIGLTNKITQNNMKRINIIAILSFCSYLCFSCNHKRDQFVNVFYKEDDNVIFLVNTESATYIEKLELNLEKDTLILTTHKKNVFNSNKFKASLFSKWKIKLNSTSGVEYLKYADKTFKLSDIKSPSKDLIERFDPSIEISPRSFPYIAE